MMNIYNGKKIYAAIHYVIVGAIIATLINTPLVQAIDPGFYSANNIIFSDPEGKNLCGEGSSTDPSTLNGNDNLQKIYNFFLGKGLKDFQAAGAVGNIAIESGGFPQRKQGHGSGELFPDPSNITSGWGIIQWTPGKKVLGIAKEAGITGPISELSTQLDIVWWHMNHTTPIGRGGFMQEYNTATNVESATTIYMNKMEAPAAATAHLANRIAAAKLALNYAKNPTSGGAVGSAAGGSSDVNCTGGSSGAVAGNIVQTAINYAWPEYHKAPYTTKKPAYEAAIQAAIKAGKYVGGLEHPGVDCGGFITRVMQDSGADPEYGGGGNTTSQLKHLKTSGKYIQIYPKSTADMKPGDIAINNGHTYMYVGKNPGFNSLIASASVSFNGDGWRAPMAGSEKPADPKYQWFRLK